MARGFALLAPEVRREISRKGGRMAQFKGTAHRWTPGEEAREAGRKGGQASRKGANVVTPVSETIPAVEEAQAEANG